uniref:Lysine-specific metallo-endopeptidase domain-containing protein n=1 Tax=Chrysolophus pictus TaxID=9089 RepID=A0A8C3L900_CHRPC
MLQAVCSTGRCPDPLPRRMSQHKAALIHTKVVTGSWCCVLSRCEDVSEELSEEECSIARQAQHVALEVLEDALRKDRLLMKNLKDVVVLTGEGGEGWVERYAMLTERLLQSLIAQLQQAVFLKNPCKAGSYAYVKKNAWDRTIYLCPLFWQAPSELQKDSQPGTLIHEASHFLGLHDITYATASFRAGSGGTAICTDGHMPLSETLQKALLNANSIEYEFEIVLRHRQPYQGGCYACCGETARNSVCENALPWDGPACGPQSTATSTIGDMVQLALLPTRDAMRRCLWNMRRVAEALGQCQRAVLVANITGGGGSVAGGGGGAPAISGLLLAPAALGNALLLAAVGFGVTTAGSITSAAATISSSVGCLVRKGEAEMLLEKFAAQAQVFTGCQGAVERARRLLEALVQKESLDVILGVFRVVVGLGRSVFNGSSALRVSTVLAGTGNATGLAGTASCVLLGLCLALDIFFITKDSAHLHRGARLELAGRIHAATAMLEREFGAIDEFCEKIRLILEEQE